MNEAGEKGRRDSFWRGPRKASCKRARWERQPGRRNKGSQNLEMDTCWKCLEKRRSLDVEAWGTWRTFEEYEAEKLDWAHRPNSLGFTLAAEGSSEQLWAEVTWSELDLMETNCGWSMHSGWVLWGVKRVRLRRPAGRPLRDCSLL